MFYKRLCTIFIAGLVGLWLGGCASTPVAALSPGTLWQDAAFDYQPQLVTETRETLFALDPELVKTLRGGDAMNAPTHRRLERLLARLYTREGILLTYSSGHTTGAMETWNNKRGDCLSLSILAYAAARSMRLSAAIAPSASAPPARTMDSKRGAAAEAAGPSSCKRPSAARTSGFFGLSG